jgi:lipopolysaccharide heptosyltransferase II
VNRVFLELVERHPEIDEAIVFDRGRARLSFSGLYSLAGFVRSLRTRQFDLAIDLQGLLRSAIMTTVSAAPIRVGFSDAREGARRFYTHQVPMPATKTHAVDRLLRVAEAFGADIIRPRFRLACTDDDRAWARATLALLPAPRIVFNLGSRWLTKRWPPEHFADLASRLQKSRGASLVTIGAAEDAGLVRAFRERLGNAALLDLCGETSLPQLAALASAADLVISNDTGPLHLASAAGARVVGIYTCTDPIENGPYGPNAAVAEAKLWCAGSYLKTCSRMDCMRELTPERVWPVVEAALDRALIKPDSSAA